jgi:hypothetical protein
MRLPVTLAASAAAVFLTAWIVIRVRRWRRRSPEEMEKLRRLEVNRRGRIVAGQILDMAEPEPGKPGPRWVMYKYDITGVSYEAAQDICALPAIVALARRRIGRIISVKYDPRVPTNSILACEEWSGVPESESKAPPEPRPPPSPAPMAEKT